MNSPEARKKSLLARRAKLHAAPNDVLPEPKKKRAPWGSLKRRSNKRTSLQHAANTQVRFCPGCGCNLEAITVAMVFAARKGM
jgi:hypothetical protein